VRQKRDINQMGEIETEGRGNPDGIEIINRNEGKIET